MSTIVLIRPGCTDFDDQHRVQGALNLPLNQRGQQQVREITEKLRGTKLEVIYSAPGEPARSTARAIGEELEIPVKESDKLRNLNQGLWQGLQIEEIQHKYPRVYKQWAESPARICPPQGEEVSAALERIRAALKKPLKKKQSFGIVASEPLATLIACMIQGDQLEMPKPLCGCQVQNSIEYLRTNGHEKQGDGTSDAAIAASRAWNSERNLPT